MLKKVTSNAAIVGLFEQKQTHMCRLVNA